MQDARRFEIVISEHDALIYPRAVKYRHGVLSQAMHGEASGNRIVLFVAGDARDLDAANELARMRIFLDPKRDEAARINPTARLGIHGNGGVAGFRFENLAVHSVDRFRADDRLLLPSVNVLDRVLVGKIAVEQSLIHLRGPDSPNGLVRNDNRTVRCATRVLMKDDDLVPAVVRPKHLVGNISAGFGAALFDLELHDALATIEKSHLKLGPNQGTSLRSGIQSPREFSGRYGGRRRLFHTEGGDAESCGGYNKSKKAFHGHRINSRGGYVLRGS